MSLQPYQPHQPYRPPIPTSLSKRQRADITYATEVEIFYQQFDAAMAALRLFNAYRLRNIQMDLQIELGERIRAHLVADDNPVTIYMLKATVLEWIKDSNQIIGRLA